MATRFRLCDEDREKYGGPEWVTYDAEQFDDMPLDELEKLEAQVIDRTGVSLVVMMARMFSTGTLLGKTVVLWLARQMAGETEPPLKDFNIKPRKLKMETVKPAGAGDPPASASSPTSSGEEPSATPADA